MDRISLVMRIQNDPTMKGVLDINKEKEIINKILKNNYIESEFMKQKMAAERNF